MLEFLSDPKILAVILSSFGAVLGWLIKNELTCRKDKAVLEEKLITMRERIATAEGTIKVLCDLLKKEVNLG